jgi:GNAT superfamily N-acetyltransferase
MIEIRTVKRSMKDYKDVAELMYSSFPENEQFPIWFLRLMSLRKCVEFLAYYDEGKLIATSFSVSSDDAVFGLYLAIQKELRSQGYGSSILKTLCEKDKDKAIYLNIEPVDETADNYEERVKRLKFYEKNDFYETGYDVIESSDRYSILTNKKPFDINSYIKTVAALSFGFVKPKTEKRA